MKKTILNIVCLVVPVIIFALLNPLMLLSWSLQTNGIRWFLAIVGLVLTGAVCFWEMEWDEDYPWVALGAWVLLLIANIIICFASSACTNAGVYANATPIEFVTEGEEASVQLPSFDDIDKLYLPDSATALAVATRKVGEDQSIVSQFNPGRAWTCSLNGETIKVVDLEYAGFFQITNNNSIPKYVIVYNDLTAEIVEVEGGIKYAPSDICSQDLMRHVRSTYKNELFGNPYFQIDDEKQPYWVVPVEEYKTFAGCRVVTGVILVDKNGKMEKYSLSDCPVWVDCVIHGDVVETYYNRYGRYNNGWWNPSKTNVTQTTDDYGYITVEDDVYVYTGVTSAAADESNVGFLLCNSRTGKMFYYTLGGAEEYSAMAACEGVVANYGYVASFPSIVLYDNEPTYVMVLKDSNGLVKKYGMCNYKNYTIVAVGDTLKECQKAYVNALANGGTKVEIDNEDLIEVTFVVTDVQYIVVDGNTTVYVKSTEGKVYKQAFVADETLILINVGDTVTVLTDNVGDINTLVEWHR